MAKKVIAKKLADAAAKASGKSPKAPKAEANETPTVDVSAKETSKAPLKPETIAKLHEAALKAVKTMDQSIVHLGKALDPIQKEGLWALKELGSHSSFETYVEGLGVSYMTGWKAMTLYRHYTSMGVNLSNLLAEIGISKAMAIMKAVSSEEDVKEWLDKAKTETTEQLIADVARIRTKSKGPKVTVATFSFRAEDQQITNIESALSLAQQELNTKDRGAAFDAICTFYNMQNLTKQESVDFAIASIERVYGVKVEITDKPKPQAPVTTKTKGGRVTGVTVNEVAEDM